MLIQNHYDGFCGKIHTIGEKARESEISWLVRKARNEMERRMEAKPRPADGFSEEEGSPICELACGAGRLTIPLAERGFEVVGMDLSETLIDIANQSLGTRRGLWMRDPCKPKFRKR